MSSGTFYWLFIISRGIIGGCQLLFQKVSVDITLSHDSHVGIYRIIIFISANFKLWLLRNYRLPVRGTKGNHMASLAVLGDTIDWLGAELSGRLIEAM